MSTPPIAPESAEEDAKIWKWCLRCGALKLGVQTFLPGSHQKKVIVSEGTRKREKI